MPKGNYRSFDQTRTALLRDKRIAAYYLAEILASKDMGILRLALKHIAGASGMARLAGKTDSQA